jgi:beta-glucosidase
MVNAGVDMAHGAQQLAELDLHAEVGGQQRRREHGPHRRRRPAHPAIKDRAGVFDEPLADRASSTAALSAAPPTAMSRARPYASRWCCSRTTACCRSPRAAGVFVAGKNADNIGHQCGGWTITGRAAAATSRPAPRSSKASNRGHRAGGGSVTFSEDGSGSAGHDVAIVVIGETPYAEGLGDDAAWRSTPPISRA